MSRIGSVARVSHEGHGAIPVINEQEIETNAWLIWQAVHEQRKLEGKNTRVQNPRTGQPGYAWHGSVSRIIHTLWPALKDTRLVDGAKAEHVRVTLNRYLRNSGNLIHSKDDRGAKPGDRFKASLWWISEHWGGVVTTNVNEHEEENVSDDTMTPRASSSDVFDVSLVGPGTVPGLTQASVDARVGDFGCRLSTCDRSFTYPQLRASHEKATHGIRVLGDGTIVTFDRGSKATDEEVAELIVAVTRDAAVPETFNHYYLRIKELDPRVPKERIRVTLKALCEGKKPRLVVTNPRSSFSRYALAESPQKPAKKQTTETPVAQVTEVITNEAVENATSEDVVIEATAVTTEPEVVEELVEEIFSPGPVHGRLTLAHHIAHLTELLNDLQRLDALERLLEIKTAELEGRTTERDEALIQVESLTAELDEVRQERDEARTTMEGIQRMLTGGSKA